MLLHLAAFIGLLLFVARCCVKPLDCYCEVHDEISNIQVADIRPRYFDCSSLVLHSLFATYFI